MYESLRDASFRLDGTIVFYKNRYIVVEGCKSVSSKLCLVGGGNTIPLTSKDLKMRCIPTGYVSVNGVLMFLSRRPTRRFRQGLRSDNTKVYDVGGKERNFNFFYDAVMRGGVVGLIPDSGEVISRDFAILDNVLYYRLREVGYSKGGKVRLKNDVQFLKEAVQEYLEVL